MISLMGGLLRKMPQMRRLLNMFSLVADISACEK
jgi:hypothetical protein